MPGASNKRSSYAERMMERARDMRKSGAFDPPPTGVGSQISAAKSAADIASEKRKNRRLFLLAGVVLLAIALISLHIPFYSLSFSGDRSGMCSTPELLSYYTLWFKTTVLPLFDGTLYNQIPRMQAGYDMHMYHALMTRFAVTLVFVACGFLLSASGLLFQSSFRNPLAAPTMMGVADGVSIGIVIFSFMGYFSMQSNPTLYVVLVYGCGIAALLLVLLLSRFIAGPRRFSVMDMLLVGTVLSQLLGSTVVYFSTFVMDLETFDGFYQLQQGMDQMGEPLTWAIVAVVSVCTLVPVFLLRFRFNLVSYSDDEVRMLGARPGLLRGVALALGSIMQLAAIASIGQVAMVSLAVPFLVRYMFRNEFRSQLLGNFIVGSIVLLLCSCLQTFFVFSSPYGSVTMPIGTIIAFVIMPLFVWMLALQRRGWE